MALPRYATSISLCEDTSKTFELFDLLTQADSNYSAINPEKIRLYVKVDGVYQEVTAGYFTAVDKDTLSLDMSSLPNFNGQLEVSVLGTDSTGNGFILDLTVQVTPVNDAPTGADSGVALANGDIYVLGLGDFGFADVVEGNALKSVVIDSVPASGALRLDGVAVVAGQEILAADIAAGKLSYLAPVDAGGSQSFTFQVRDDGGTEGCGGTDLDATPNTFAFVVPVPGAITGTVLEDTDNDNVGDTPIPGVTVTLLDSTGTVVATTTTDGSGNYVFNGVPSGNYSVVEANKPGYLDVSDKDGGDLNVIAVTVVPGATSSGNNFVDERPAVLGDRVWEDSNANGVQDAGELGIANVVVQLRDASGAVVQSTTTGANGQYSFSVAPGTYSVAVVKPAGYEISGQDLGGVEATDSDINAAGQSGLVSLVSGQNNPDVDAGLYKLAELGDKVWYDSNANGVQDAGEAGVQGVRVSLLDAAGNVVSSQNTDAAGNYLFSGLKPGTYSVQFDKATLPAGYAFTTRDAAAAIDTSDSDADAATGRTVQTVLQSGESDRSWDAGIVATSGTITGSVREDLDNNNTGDAPIAGVTVVLKDSAGNVVASTTTDTSGNYTFNNVPAGNYTVEETNKPGYLDVSDKDGGNPNVIAVTLPAGGTSSGNNFVDERPAVLGDRVWEDSNANGVQDAGELGIANVVVQLRDASGAVVQSTTTGANGQYSFSVAPGTYSVAVVKPAGYEISGQDLGGVEATDSDINAAGQSGLVSLVSGQNNPDVDAGLYKLAELGDKVWYDSNANGVQDAGEAGVQGVRVSLLDAAGNVVSSQNTDAVGNYLFSGLKPGTYSVQFDKATLPAGYAFTTRDAAAATDTSDSDADAATGRTVQTVLQSGESDRSWDAGIVATSGTITGSVREDLDNNNTGDVPIAGVTVVLKDSAGNVVASTTTDTSGNYTFNNVPAGNYTVEETNKPGYLDVSDKDGGNPNVIAVTLPAGGTSSGNNFVDERPAALGDKVWLDKNANGVQDAGEAGLAGVTVKLVDAGGNVVGTTTTGADGSYLFNNLAPGDYTAQVVAPAGYFLSGKDLGGNDATDSDFDPLTGKTGVVNLSAGETDLSVDGGLYQKASIGDRVWSDSNGNGIQDAGEAGVAGATVKLLDASGNVIATTQTDANGNYLFKDLTPGTYSVQFTAPAGCSFTLKDAGSNDATDSDVGAVLGTTNLIVNGSFESGASGWCGQGDAVEVSTAGSFGVSGATGSYVAELDANKTGTVTGFYQDVATVAGQTYQLSVDLAQRSGSAAGTNTVEIWWEGVKVATVDPASTTLTKYSFTVTAADASSRLEFREQAGDDDSLGGIIDNVRLVTRSGGSVQNTIQTTLESGENDMSWDAGIYCPPTPPAPPATASIGDKVWEDLNYNGLQDAGEAGIAGVTVKLLNSAGSVVATTTTNSSGNYLFSNVAVGDYKLQVVAPSGYYYTKQDQGTSVTVDSDVNSSGLTSLTTLTAGETDLTWDAGLYRKASVGDRVWTDWNSNGLQDSGDGGIANCTVKLLNASGVVIATTTTDANGNYKFTNLDPGQYSLSFDKSAAYYYTGQYDWYGNPYVSYVSSSTWQFTTKDVSGNSYDTRDSDVSRVSATVFNQGYTDKFTLVSGQYDNTRDAGVSPIAIDLDGDGIRTIARENSNGSFDLFGTGTAIKSGWLSSGDAFLVVDGNGNGRIDDVGEMFGGNSAGLGFAKLAGFDSNGDGLVDSQDARFAELKVWRDANSNQITDQGELLSLSEVGLASLKVSYVALPAIDEQGNLHLERSSATLANGDSVDMTDVYFNVSAEDAAAAGVTLPDMASLLGNDQSVDCILGQAIPPLAATAAAPLAGEGGLATLTQLLNLYDDQQPILMAA